MNKKLFLISIPLLLPLVSCGQVDHPTVVPLEYGTHIGMDEEIGEYSHLKRISGADVTALVNAKQNFVLIAHSSDRKDCTCFSEWHDNVLSPYIKKHNLLVYLVELSEVSGEGKESYGMKFDANYATLAIFGDGKLVHQQIASESVGKWVSDRTEFAAWMNYRLKMPSLFYIDKDELDEKYASHTEFTIYFSRSSCGDCSYFQNNYLKTYMAENENLEASYIIDCDAVGIRGVLGNDGVVYYPSSKESANQYEKQAQAQWNQFKVDYGLAESDTNPAGWSTGYVPTVFHINPEGNGKKTGDVIDGAMVIFNDTVKDGAIDQTYFTEERLELEALTYLRESKEISESNKILTGKKVGEQGGRSNSAYRREETAVYHNPIAKVFLDEFIGN